MIVLNSQNEHGKLTVTLRIERDEFLKALMDAYMDDTEHYVVPGYAPGLAPREEIEKLYGETALFDEALDRCVPRMYSRYLAEEKIRIIGRPKLTSVTWMEGGGAAFTVEADVYPSVKLGQYKEIRTDVDPVDEAAFEAAVLTIACQNMQAEVPDGMVEQKLDAMLAGEKMQFGQDAVYHVLADCIAILKAIYEECDVSRPMNQIQAEAMDVMLQTMSGDNKTVSAERFEALLAELVERYRPVPKHFRATLEQVMESRRKQKDAMQPEEQIGEAFKAYLSSIELTEPVWRKERKPQAAQAARFDLMLAAIAEEEKLEISDDEMEEALLTIARSCNMELDEVMAAVDFAPIKEQLLRDKARKLVVQSALGC